mmetsp:Transcript_36964/g.76848  ORF Transcript_36964/g.76848 Transcript_36964/m.76848 type:complete len:192 (-) Transcript_36964:43-618(-)
MNNRLVSLALMAATLLGSSTTCTAFSIAPSHPCARTTTSRGVVGFPLYSQTSDSAASAPAAEDSNNDDGDMDYAIPEDAIIQIQPNAMRRMEELRAQQNQPNGVPLFLRVGVKSGGCSGMSYVMDFCKESDITEDDVVDDYGIVQAVVDPKSLLYLYGLELDYSSDLIGGGFKFFNPNSAESCGCGSSFSV